MTDFLNTDYGARLAYNFTEGDGPCVVFLGGFRSDKEGTKAVFLEDWAKARGRPFLRLDYTGHGQSSGDFLEGSIGDWARDAQAVIDAVVPGSAVLVGSSMGGWIAALLTKAIPQKISGFVGIAAAPDFTEDSMWGSMTEDQRAELMEKGQIAQPSDYSDEPYIITRKLIEEGRKTLVLRDPLPMRFPVTLLQGTEDTDVDMSVALRFLDHIDGESVRLTLVKGADHRFSDPMCLTLIADAVDGAVIAAGG